MIGAWCFIVAALLIAYTYVLYPLISLLVGAEKQKPVSAELPGITFLVPAHNEASVIVDKIRNFSQINYPEHLTELIVGDDGSTDGTAKAAAPFLNDRIRLLSNAERAGKAESMNRLVAAARHSVLLMSDANVMLSQDAARILVAQLAHPNVGAVTGEVRLIGSDLEFSAGESLYYLMERRIQQAESRMFSVMGVDGGMYLLRRQLYQTLPQDTILDDFLVSMNVLRAGYRVVYDRDAKATESGTPSARQEFARRVRIAAGAVQLLLRRNVPRWYQPVCWFQFASHKVLRWLSPLLLVCLFVSNCFLANAHPLLAACLAVQLVIGTMILATFLIPPLRKSRLGAVIFYFGFSQIAMLIGLWKGLLNLQTPRWEKAQRQASQA